MPHEYDQIEAIRTRRKVRVRKRPLFVETGVPGVNRPAGPGEKPTRVSATDRGKPPKPTDWRYDPGGGYIETKSGAKVPLGKTAKERRQQRRAFGLLKEEERAAKRTLPNEVVARWRQEYEDKQRKQVEAELRAMGWSPPTGALGAVGSFIENLGADVAALPGGIYHSVADLGKAAALDFWGSMTLQDPEEQNRTLDLLGEWGKSYLDQIEYFLNPSHPLRSLKHVYEHPGFAVLTVVPLGKVVGRGVSVGRMAPRIARQPRYVTTLVPEDTNTIANWGGDAARKGMDALNAPPSSTRIATRSAEGELTSIAAYRNTREDLVIDHMATNTGKGYGKDMFLVLARKADDEGRGMLVVSEPQSVGFWRRMGMVENKDLPGMFKWTPEQVSAFMKKRHVSRGKAVAVAYKEAKRPGSALAAGYTGGIAPRRLTGEYVSKGAVSRQWSKTEIGRAFQRGGDLVSIWLGNRYPGAKFTPGQRGARMFERGSRKTGQHSKAWVATRERFIGEAVKTYGKIDPVKSEAMVAALEGPRQFTPRQAIETKIRDLLDEPRTPQNVAQIDLLRKALDSTWIDSRKFMRGLNASEDVSGMADVLMAEHSGMTAEQLAASRNQIVQRWANKGLLPEGIELEARGYFPHRSIQEMIPANMPTTPALPSGSALGIPQLGRAFTSQRRLLEWYSKSQVSRDISNLTNTVKSRLAITEKINARRMLYGIGDDIGASAGAKVAFDTLKAEGGFTLHADLSRASVSSGYLASRAPFELQIPLENLRPSHIEGYRNLVADQMQPGEYIGGWVDDQTAYLDVTRLIDNSDEALAFGRENGQLAVYDAAADESIVTELSEAEANAIKAPQSIGLSEDLVLDAAAKPVPGRHFMFVRNPDAKLEKIPREVRHALEDPDGPGALDIIAEWDNQWVKPGHVFPYEWAGDLDNVRIVPRSIVQTVLSDARAGTSMASSIAGTLNALVRSAVLYLPYGGSRYVARNTIQNMILLSLTQPRAFIWVPKAVRGVFKNEDLFRWIQTEAGTILAASSLPERVSGRGILHKIERESTRQSRRFAGWIGNVADEPWRVASWIQYARDYGFKNEKAWQYLRESDDPALIRVRENISQYVREDMIDFDALTPWEREVLTRYMFIYPFQKGASKWPLMFAREYPVKLAILGAIGIAGQRGGPSVPGMPQSATEQGRVGGIALGWLSPWDPLAQNVERGLAQIRKFASNRWDISPTMEFLSPQWRELGVAGFGGGKEPAKLAATFLPGFSTQERLRRGGGTLVQIERMLGLSIERPQFRKQKREEEWAEISGAWRIAGRGYNAQAIVNAFSAREDYRDLQARAEFAARDLGRKLTVQEKALMLTSIASRYRPDLPLWSAEDIETSPNTKKYFEQLGRILWGDLPKLKKAATDATQEAEQHGG